MFISEKYKLVFLEVPRTGSRSITDALTRMDPGSPTVQIRRRQLALVDYHNMQIPDHVDDNYVVVAAHRNPYERLWSHWKFRHQWGDPEIFKAVSWQSYVMWACIPGALPEITRALPEMPITQMLDCDRVTHWLHYDHLGTSWQKLAENTGLPLPELSWINRSRDRGGHREAYNAELAAMVAKRFADDFIMFNYDTESWRDV